MINPNSQQKSPKCSTRVQFQKGQNDLSPFPMQTIQYHSNPSLCPNHLPKEAEVEWFCIDTVQQLIVYGLEADSWGFKLRSCWNFGQTIYNSLRISFDFSSGHEWMWELDCKENWVPKNWWFWTVVLEKTLRVPWTAKRSNQSILKEISREYSLEGLMLMLKLQYFGHVMRRANLLEKTLMLGKIEGRQRRWWQRMRWLDGVTNSMTWVWASCVSWWWTGKPVCCSPWCPTGLSNSTELCGFHTLPP